ARVLHVITRDSDPPSVGHRQKVILRVLRPSPHVSQRPQFLGWLTCWKRAGKCLRLNSAKQRGKQQTREKARVPSPVHLGPTRRSHPSAAASVGRINLHNIDCPLRSKKQRRSHNTDDAQRFYCLPSQRELTSPPRQSWNQKRVRGALRTSR